MRVLVIGGYGLIGAEVCRALIRSGRLVTGMGRSAARGRASLPDIDWIGADLAGLLRAEDWAPHLAGKDAVVHCAGLLQDGLGDNVAKVQRDSVVALVTACERAGVERYVHISAPGVRDNASTAFYRTKAEAEAAITASALDWTILRPGLVIAPQAYGGTSLVRMLAAFPLVQPLVLGDALIQTVSVWDVSTAVVDCLTGRHKRRDFDLVEDHPHRLSRLVKDFRQWLGFAPARAVVELPVWAGRLVGAGADVAGWMGWRPGLRTTSQRVLAEGVLGDPRPWRKADGHAIAPLAATLRAMPATAQEKLYARAMLAFPFLLLILSAFWTLSGAVGLVRWREAAAVLDGAMPDKAVLAAVIGGGVADIVIGGAMLWRPLCRIACLVSIAAALGYMAGAALIAPHLYADPLGPMVKVAPAIGLALAVTALRPGR